MFLNALLASSVVLQYVVVKGLHTCLMFLNAFFNMVENSMIGFISFIKCSYTKHDAFFM